VTRTLVAAAWLLGLVSCNSALAAPKTAPQVLADVKKTYAKVTDLSASFQQTITNVTFGTTKTHDGQVWLRRPAKMRWDYYAPQRKGQPRTTAKHFVSNGVTLYMIDRDNQQLMKNKLELSPLPVAITFLYGQGDVTKDFRAVLDTSKKYGKRGDHVLKLTPKQPSAQYKSLYFVVDPATSQVRESIVVDTADNVSRFVFTNINTAPTMKDYYFEVDEKDPAFAHYQIIDATLPAPTAP
jgi:outer membrane lipoprotein carrier protein